MATRRLERLFGLFTNVVLSVLALSGLVLGVIEMPSDVVDGRVVDGIRYLRELAESHHRDIIAYGGWRAYWAARETAR